MIDVSNEIKGILGEQQSKELRQSCLKYLKENILRIVKQKVELVYILNSYRKQVIELPRFLEAVKVVDRGDWKFEIFIDENDLNYVTEWGEQIHEIGTGEIVTNINQYFKSPILNSIRELDFIRMESEKESKDFIKKNLPDYLNKITRR